MNKIRYFALLMGILFWAMPSIGQDNVPDSLVVYWHITPHQSIVWDLTKEERLPHGDNMEMAGRSVAGIIYYNVDKDKRLTVDREIIFPQLRTYLLPGQPWWKAYRAYLKFTYSDEFLPVIIVGEHKFMPQVLDSVEIEGKLTFYHKPVLGLRVVRTFYPSMHQRFFVEEWTVYNVTDSAINMQIFNTQFRQQEKGYKGLYTRKVYTVAPENVVLKPGDSLDFAVYYAATLNNESFDSYDFREARAERDSFIRAMKNNFVLETPDDVINTLFYFSKIRAAENLFHSSKMGLIHSPGGGNYYVGLWANDQGEYSSPFFPYLGYEPGNIAAYNCYNWYLKHLPPDFDHKITSSYEMDADLTCCGLDRGDAAMLAYGATEYVLLTGDKKIAEHFWPLITWTLEYNNRHRNSQGAVTSDSDEMEGRLPTGKANLATSSLYYGALKYAAYLADALGKHDTAALYRQRARQMADVIENYFGADIDGLHTYRYFDGNTKLRHWICLPLVMGIQTREQGTLDALFNKLWTENGVLVELDTTNNEKPVFWDRGTLYAFRGAFKAGATDLALQRLIEYSTNRLLGFHVPYVVEAYPENNMKHLSAESALYARIFPEGLLGMEPTGFHSFKLTPRLPSSWNGYALRKIHAFGSDFDIEIRRAGTRIDVRVTEKGKTILHKKIKPGQTIEVNL